MTRQLTEAIQKLEDELATAKKSRRQGRDREGDRGARGSTHLAAALSAADPAAARSAPRFSTDRAAMPRPARPRRAQWLSCPPRSCTSRTSGSRPPSCPRRGSTGTSSSSARPTSPRTRSRRARCAPARCAELLGDTLAATHLSAAWIHGALHEPPARHTVQRAVPAAAAPRDRPPAALPRPVRRSGRPAADRRGAGHLSRAHPRRPVPRRPTTDYAAAARMMADADPRARRRAPSRGSTAHGALPNKRAALVVLRELAARGAVRTT